MLEFHSTAPVPEQVEARYRRVFSLIETALWGALPATAVQCVLFGTNLGSRQEYESRFYDAAGETYIDWIQDPVCEQIIALLAELRSLVPGEEVPGRCRFRATLCDQGGLAVEFLCLPDMVRAGTEIFMCRVRRQAGSARQVA